MIEIHVCSESAFYCTRWTCVNTAGMPLGQVFWRSARVTGFSRTAEIPGAVLEGRRGRPCGAPFRKRNGAASTCGKAVQGVGIGMNWVRFVGRNCGGCGRRGAEIREEAAAKSPSRRYSCTVIFIVRKSDARQGLSKEFTMKLEIRLDVPSTFR
jgi:hypothetical protein